MFRLERHSLKKLIFSITRITRSAGMINIDCVRGGISDGDEVMSLSSMSRRVL